VQEFDPVADKNQLTFEHCFPGYCSVIRAQIRRPSGARPSTSPTPTCGAWATPLNGLGAAAARRGRGRSRPISVPTPVLGRSAGGTERRPTLTTASLRTSRCTCTWSAQFRN